MELTNAFDLLGAMPSDDDDRLQELLDDKELLVEDTTSIKNAYLELKNPQKRIIHEIEFFCKDDFSDFLSLVSNSFEKTPTLKQGAEIFIKTGRWFESHTNGSANTREDEEFDLYSLFADDTSCDTDRENLLNKINSARATANISSIDSNALEKAIDELKREFVDLSVKYLDGIKEKSVVGIFNQIVKIDDFQSFFIDELMAHYELIISEEMSNTEQECRDSFDTVERTCTVFNNGGPLSYQFEDGLTNFIELLKKWDRFAQPLQVNMQIHGGQHDTSERLLHDLRNKVIDLCNKFQEVLGNMMEQWSTAMSRYDFSTAQNIKHRINEKLPNSIRMIDGLIRVIDTFVSTFTELEVDLEQLKKDKRDLVELKSTINKINDSAQQETKRLAQAKEIKERESRDCRIIHGVCAVISLVIMIICFACGSVGGGVAFIFITVAFGICCAAYPNLEGKNVMKWIIITGAILAFIVGMAVGNSSSNKTSSKTSTPSSTYNSSTSYVVTFDKDGGSGGSLKVSAKRGQSMPYATAPTKDGYTFGGYYTSRNGQGTKYYSASMSSSRSWDKTVNTTLYAYWIIADDGIKLTKDNFQNYFNFSSNCSVSRSAYSSYGTATYSFSLSPKSSFKYSSNSNNPSSITVTIGLDISSFNKSYGTPSEYKITVTLYKSSGYKYSGSKTYSVSSYEKYWLDGIYSVDGKIYK